MVQDAAAGGVPLAMKGVVVGIGMRDIDVVWDVPFMGGETLQGVHLIAVRPSRSRRASISRDRSLPWALPLRQLPLARKHHSSPSSVLSLSFPCTTTSRHELPHDPSIKTEITCRSCKIPDVDHQSPTGRCNMAMQQRECDLHLNRTRHLWSLISRDSNRC
ncbi:hypothetical protein BCR39DRAFT_21408 [Naematelia encephala]|uniref:5'-3' exoribonuclease 1 SH3-like domain-containing protein n=1 Tax=Naematelia encephala TaxID=71784 RepID=A0A1Y2BLD4_9TREE|nr:hypothetical protein BCR39DRAFT_21408 [Naematelia encephala]